jgi:hypothetical protein
MTTLTPRTITLRTGAGERVRTVALVKRWDFGHRGTWAGEGGPVRDLVGMDQDGIFYRTRRRGNWNQVVCPKESADLTVRIWGPDAP